MKTVINIKQLIGTLVLVTTNDEAPEKVAAAVTNALTKAISSVLETQEYNLDKVEQPISVPDM